MDQHVVSSPDIEQNTLLVDIATRDIVCLAPADTLGEAARVMAKKRISSILVMNEDEQAAGIITEHDMLRAMQSGQQTTTTLREIMTSPVITVPVSMSALDAYQVCLRNGVRHLVIVDDARQLFGLVSETDFRMHIHLTALSGRRQIASVMTRSVFNLPPHASLQEALNLMQAHRDTCIVVTEDERPLGIITERDIVRLYSDELEQTATPVRETMTFPVLTIPLDSTVNQAAEQMLSARVRHLVVVDGMGRLAGLVNEHDLTQAMTLGLIDDKLIAEGAFLHTLINTIPDMVWLKDAEGVYLACNPSFERFFGAAERNIIGKTDYDFVAREQADVFRQRDRAAITGNAPNVNEEWSTYIGDGHRELLETIRTPMHDNQGRLIGVLGISRNITERQQLEERLKASEEKFRSVFESASDCIELISMDGHIVDINHIGYERMGYSKAEMQDQPLAAFSPPEYADRIADRMTLIKNRGHATFESARLRKDGSLMPIEVNSRIAEMDGQPLFLSISRDISERKKAEDVLRQQKQLSDDIINSLPGIFYMLDTAGHFVRVNPQFMAVTGYSQEELDGKTALDFFEGFDKNLIAQRMQEVFESGDSSIEAELIIKSGHKIPYYFTGHRTSIDGQLYLVGLGTDITARKRSEDALRITASVFDTSQEAILITDADNVIVDVNPAFTRITGYRREEVLGHNPKLLNSGRQNRAFYAAMWESLAEKKSWRGEIWNRRKSGETYAELLSISVICDADGKVQRHVGVFSDISHLKEHEAELSRVAHYDALTGIPNRVLLADRMKQAFAQTIRDRDMLAVCYLDLDGFKPINDNMGHDAGDLVLVEVAKRIAGTIRGGDTVARLGGDEFVVLLLGLEKGQECMVTLGRLLEAIARPIMVKGQPLTVSASIGVSLYPLDDEDPDTLLRHADQAMYIAKQSGKNRFHIYDPSLDLRTRNQYEFLQSIHLGLQQGQFELYYQPKINLRTRRLVGAEALIRWRHPERGLLPPSEFLRAAESTELDIEIGDWVIATALDQIEQWRGNGLDIEVSINISAHHLESAHFVEKLRRQLARHAGTPPGRLQIEVLETAALNDIAIVRGIIDACRLLGVEFALDDFGTGYSSLTYLGSLPVDVLKIDQSFVRNMLEDKGDMAIVQGVIALARAFERKTVAEGIETAAHYQALLDMGCEFGQGYGIARPMPADKLMNWLPDDSILLDPDNNPTKSAS